MQELAVPILNRGEIDGFVLINHKPSREAYRPDELDLLEFAVQQIGLDLTALEREQYKQQASDLELLASAARSSAEEMRTLLQLALGRHADHP
jgi:GAF domain-containing protein